MAQTKPFETSMHEFLKNVNIGNVITINDLKEWVNEGKKLSKNQLNALNSFDRYRINELNNQENEEHFHKRFRELQVMANLYPFDEFLNGEYLLGSDE